MKRVMMHTTSCIYTNIPNTHTHEHQHSHRLKPSTRSHSLGLKGRGEHGQSWHELLVCVRVCVWGSVPRFIFAVCGLVSLVVYHLNPAGRLRKYRYRGFGCGFVTFCLFNHDSSDVPSSKLLHCKGSNLSMTICTIYTHSEYCWLLDCAPLPKPFMFKCLICVLYSVHDNSKQY